MGYGWRWRAILFIFAVQFSIGHGLLCYRCDSHYNDDCQFYPAPMSSFEDCSEKPLRTYMEYKDTKQKYDEATQQPLYIRYRYKLCPILERTIKQYVSVADFCDSDSNSLSGSGPVRKPSPMEGVSYVCGKAVTHGPNGIRVRRGCTPDLFLNGTNAGVSHAPHAYGFADVACFCTKDLCNRGGNLESSSAIAISILLIFINGILMMV